MRTGMLLLALATLGLSAAPALAENGPDPLAIRGELAYRARIALPPASVAVVELRDAAAPPEASAVAELRTALQGRQVPVPFELLIDRAVLAPDARYAIRGGILLDGRPIWASEPRGVDTAGNLVEVGTLELAEVQSSGFASTLRCGDLLVTVGFVGQQARLEVDGAVLDLDPVEAASGARFADGAEPPTSFWSKGDRAQLVLRGVEYPECEAEPVPPRVFRAGGNEPGWSLLVDAAGLELTTGYGERRRRADTVTLERVPGGRIYRAAAEGTAITAAVTDRVCVDTMTGVPRPAAVEVTVGDERLSGCGGEPAELLTGGEWQVTGIEGAAVLADAVPTIEFDAEGSVYAKGSCNRYRGGYKLTGESFTMGPFASTMMACPEPMMEQEQRFLAAMAKVAAFAMTPEGGLELKALDGTVLVAAARG